MLYNVLLSTNMKQAHNYPQPSYQRYDLAEIVKHTAEHEWYTSCLYLAFTSNNLVQKSSALCAMAKKACEEDQQHYLVLKNHCHSLQKGSLQKKYSTTPLSMKSTMPAKTMDTASTHSLLEQLKKAESISIDYQKQICSMTIEHDYQTFDLVYSLLNENIQHEDSIAFLLTQHLDGKK